MLQKISFTSILAEVIQKVEANTGLECYDAIPVNAQKPYYHAEFIGSIPEPSKTMQKDRYQIEIHVFADAPGNSSVQLYDSIHKLEEALTEVIELPGDYEVTLQIPNGVSQIMEELDESKHAVIGYDFVVFSDYKMKI
ncbi:DUF5072 domain-containing protein [Marinilactibacillus psychrotolerans]|uniref:DUF5072 domain-containing protein n=1 Tax=Marinilactibacillus psychrotolerans TaxID=191770 RepID=A0A5R9C478_9LACT|nr:DUF5072 family protein [Marinilactibacillus psychrotolerans]TLQ07563.1 DUF5072 domain-containing protein [Marinilactibacillus psychrotolerans]